MREDEENPRKQEKTIEGEEERCSRGKKKEKKTKKKNAY
jgi:hypothetical protein